MAEAAHVLIGEIPYRVEVVPAANIKPPYANVRLLESIGKEITADPATTYFAKDSILFVWDTGRKHVSTGHRLFRLANPKEMQPE